MNSSSRLFDKCCTIKKKKNKKVWQVVAHDNYKKKQTSRLGSNLDIVFISSAFAKRPNILPRMTRHLNNFTAARCKKVVVRRTYLSASRRAACRDTNNPARLPPSEDDTGLRLPPTQRSNSTSSQVNAEAPVNEWGIYCSLTGSSWQIKHL